MPYLNQEITAYLSIPES